MSQSKIQSLIGLAGVANSESEKARRIGRRFEIPMLLVALWILVEWYAQLHGIMPKSVSLFFNWLIWLFFVCEITVLTYHVEDKWLYLRTNWINILIIVMGIPVIGGVAFHVGLLRALRLLLLLAIIVNISDTLRQILSRNNLGITLVVALVLIIMSGVVITGLDPSIKSIWQGLWWAWVTVTTVGYGDVVPATLPGKIFGAFLILLGIGLFSLLTANFSAFFISREEQATKEIEKQTLEKLEAIEQKLLQLEEKLGIKNEQ
jgi:voltage-gated potassium channel